MITLKELCVLAVTVTSIALTAPSDSTSHEYWKDRPVIPLKYDYSSLTIPRTGTDRGLYNEELIEGDILKDPRRPHVSN